MFGVLLSFILFENWSADSVVLLIKRDPCTLLIQQLLFDQ